MSQTNECKNQHKVKFITHKNKNVTNINSEIKYNKIDVVQTCKSA